METATEKPSAEQRALLNKLILSSVFTAEEAHRTAIWLNSPAANKERATEVIDDALARIKKRDQAKKASADRRAEYHENKDNGNGGEESPYPPGDTRMRTPLPMGIRPMANRTQNPHPNPHPKQRQLLYQLPKSCRSKQSIGSMAWITQTRMKPRKPPAKRSSANQHPTRQAISKHLAHTTHRRNKLCI